MPLIDMPLDELREYTGLNPKPSDFDSYWDTALAEMSSVDPTLSLESAEIETPYCECFHLTFTGVGGARVYAKYAKPKTHGKGPALLQFHGYTGDSGDWTGLFPYAAAGFHVFAMDCRGQGGRSQDLGGVIGNTHRGHIIRGLDDSPERLLYRQIFLDTAQLATIAGDMEGVDSDRMGAMGGSQGGGLTIACAALAPQIKRLAPVFPFLSDYRRVWEMDLADRAYIELKEFFRHFDPQHSREDEIFTRLGYIDIQYLAPRITGQVLMGTGLMDNVCPPSTQFAVYNKIKSSKQMELYPDFGHERLPGFADKSFSFLMGL